ARHRLRRPRPRAVDAAVPAAREPGPALTGRPRGALSRAARPDEARGRPRRVMRTDPVVSERGRTCAETKTSVITTGDVFTCRTAQHRTGHRVCGRYEYTASRPRRERLSRAPAYLSAERRRHRSANALFSAFVPRTVGVPRIPMSVCAILSRSPYSSRI